MVSFFFLSYPFFDCGPVFRGDTQPIEKNLLDFRLQTFMLNLLSKKKYLKTIIIPEVCKTQEIDGVFWSNLKYFNKFWVQKRTLKLKKRFENSKFFTFHFFPYYYMYPTCKISHTKKCMPAKLLLVDLF